MVESLDFGGLLLGLFSTASGSDLSYDDDFGGLPLGLFSTKIGSDVESLALGGLPRFFFYSTTLTPSKRPPLVF